MLFANKLHALWVPTGLQEVDCLTPSQEVFLFFLSICFELASNEDIGMLSVSQSTKKYLRSNLQT